jgi:hypothetical protein
VEIIERVEHWGRTTPDDPAHKSGGRSRVLAMDEQRRERPSGERGEIIMIPRRFSFLESFPTNTNGKADRRRLAEALT